MSTALQYQNQQSKEFFKDLHSNDTPGVKLRKNMFSYLSLVDKKLTTMNKESLQKSLPVLPFLDSSLFAKKKTFLNLPITIRKLADNIYIISTLGKGLMTTFKLQRVGNYFKVLTKSTHSADFTPIDEYVKCMNTSD